MCRFSLLRIAVLTWAVTLVVKQCALDRDLGLFDAGDQTEVGEKGITLRCVSSPLIRSSSHVVFSFSIAEANRLCSCASSPGLHSNARVQARLTLARAIYSSADILLLDDVRYSILRDGPLANDILQVLAALDVHTGRWIVDQCFKGDLVRGRTVLLVVCKAS